MLALVLLLEFVLFNFVVSDIGCFNHINNRNTFFVDCWLECTMCYSRHLFYVHSYFIDICKSICQKAFIKGVKKVRSAQKNDFLIA